MSLSDNTIDPETNSNQAWKKHFSHAFKVSQNLASITACPKYILSMF